MVIQYFIKYTRMWPGVACDAQRVTSVSVWTVLVTMNVYNISI